MCLGSPRTELCQLLMPDHTHFLLISPLYKDPKPAK